MAAQSFSAEAEDDLTCPVCYELLRDPNTPKLLDCPHVCCAVCIQKMIEGGRQIVECPECRHVTNIPKEGVTAMRTNLRVRRLSEKHEEHKRTQINAAMCPKHNITVAFYCKKCNIAGCSSCMMYNHNGSQHDVDEVQIVHKEQKGHIEAIFKQADKELEECKQSVNELSELQSKMERMLNKQRENIKKKVELAMEKVKQEGQILIDDLQKNEQPRIDRVQQDRNRLRIQIQEVTGVMTTAKKTAETTEKHEYVVKHDELVQTVSFELGMDTKGQIDRTSVIGMTKYVHDKEFDMQGTLGRILQVRELRCELIQEFGDFKDANDITVTLSSLLVVNDYSGMQVINYSQQKNGQYKRQSSLYLSIKNTIEPYGVDVTSFGKYLVARHTHVEMYSPLGKYEGTLTFRQDGDVENESALAYGIKVMPDGRVVVADWDRLMLTILSQEEIVMGTIRTSIKPMRIAVMPRGRIAVSYWKKDNVCVIDLKSGRQVRNFDIPHALGLCYHEETDCLLVGRCLELTNDGLPKMGTGVIDQYCCTTGRLVACIAEDLYAPQNMTFTPDGMLAVADGKTAKVYKVM